MQRYRSFVWLCAGLCLVLTSCGLYRNTAGGELSDEARQKFEYFYLEAERQKALGHNDAAFDLMCRAAEIDTTSAAARFFLAPYYLQLGNYEQARTDLRYAAEQYPGNYWYNVVYANFSQQSGQHDEAIRIWSRLLKQNPDKGEINSALAEAYTAKGDLKSAVACYDSLESAMGMMEPITIEKLKLYGYMGNRDAMVAEAEKLQRTFPQNTDYMRLLGDIYLEVGRDSAALSMYDRALALEPENGYVYLSKAGYYEKKGDSIAYNNEIRNALMNRHIDVNTKLNIFSTYIIDLMKKKQELNRVDSLFADMLEQYPQEEPVHRLFGMYLSSRQEFTRAEEQYAIAADLAPTNPENWLQLIGLYLYQEKYPEVIEVGKRAIQYVPDQKDIYMYVAVASTQTKSYAEALDMLETGLTYVDERDNETKSFFYGQMGDVYHSSGDREKAYAMYDKALSYNASNIAVLNNYSYFLATEGRDLDKAERMSAQTVKAEPDNATYLDTYAWIFFKKGDYSLARLYMKNALDKSPEASAELFEHYGDILYMLGEVDEAVEYWQKALDAGSESAELLKEKIKQKKYIEP
ncbi:tetratricopeptide repeat protein [Barnesiella viscericola]|uniref:Tetratricopeptide repeat protein n=1 Tax=Barnesiella viscericola TaxID=397865 RepID=A0A921MPI7_9BACT|nr:tetratricopeptide repeat protein [Barnesiella viscericola]HJG88140.1 tetratricopeptide repeat protein [Barnesiella viscericola]